MHGLDDGSAALDPIAAIKVVDTAEGTVASVMNVAADHAVVVGLSQVPRQVRCSLCRCIRRSRRDGD
jgi:hypothetical protein